MAAGIYRGYFSGEQVSSVNSTEIPTIWTTSFAGNTESTGWNYNPILGNVERMKTTLARFCCFLAGWVISLFIPPDKDASRVL
jgi:hypothetical protein